MKQVSTDELVKISAFIGSCNDMINGKFILADIKISKILKMITYSDELYNYITQCLINFDFVKELHRAEVKNRFNGGDFVLPEEESKIVAMVFNLLVEFNTKQIDFYSFIKDNFSSLTPGSEYNNFSKRVLVPFKDIIAKEFGLNSFEQSIKFNEEEQTVEPKVEEKKEEAPQSIEVKQEEIEEEVKKPDFWNSLANSTDTLIETINNERKIKTDLKEELIYLLNTVKYCLHYEDIRIINAIFSSVNLLTKNVKSIKFIFKEIENEIISYYDSKKSIEN